MISTLADYYPSVSLEYNIQTPPRKRERKKDVFLQNNRSKIPLQLCYKYDQFGGGGDQKEKYKGCANSTFKSTLTLFLALNLVAFFGTLFARSFAGSGRK